MTPATHQTVRLARGKHRTPDNGACVMELASMLAGEPFSDRPRSVCPVIGEFLRAYNDSVDDARRQDLYRFAAAVVGTRSTPDVEAARARLCIAWVSDDQGGRWPRLRRAIDVLRPGLPADDIAIPTGPVARVTARRLARRRAAGHQAALRLVECMIECGGRPDRDAVTETAAGPSRWVTAPRAP